MAAACARRGRPLSLLLVPLLVLLAVSLTAAASNGTASGNENCVEDAGEEELFPGNIFTDEQRKQGAIVIHFIVSIYGFIIIALVCEDYFLPAVEVICEVLNLAPDIAAATFMSMATSAPELFVNIVSTFLSDSTMGVGTTVGSATFNVLGIATFSGLAAASPIALKRRAVWRDSVIYMCAVGVVAAVAYDGRVEWYEALAMVLCSVVYLVFMFTHKRLALWARSTLRSDSTIKLTSEPRQPPAPRQESPSAMSVSTIEAEVAAITKESQVGEESDVQLEPQGKVKKRKGPFRLLWWVVSRPAAVALHFTVPDCSKPRWRKLVAVTFLMSVVWIALAAYTVSWMLSIIGHTFRIDDAVMGITFLAAGGSLPEGISSVIMARKGVGSMGISNGLGANTLNMLMNLGMPWLIRSLLPGGKPPHVLSDALPYNLLALLGAVVALNVILLLARYRLSRKQGAVTLVVFLAFLTFMVLSELGILHMYEKKPICS